MQQRRYWLTIGFIACLGVLVRLWQLGQASYWIDESYSIALANAITQHGWPITEAGLLITRSILYHYLLAGVLGLVGDSSAWWLRLPSVIFGIGALIAATAVARQLFSQRVAVVTATLMAFSVWEIAWSRQVRMYSALQCTTWLTIYCYVRWRQQRNYLNIALLVASTTITVVVHELGSLVVIFLLLHRLLEHLINKPVTTKQLIGCGLGLVVSFVLLAGVMHFGFGFAFVNYWPNYWLYLFTTLPITLLLVVTVLCQRQLVTLPVVWLISCVVLTVGFFSFAIELLQYRYLFFVLPAILMVAAVGGVAFWWSARRKVVWRSSIICAAVAAIVLGEFTLWPQAQYLLESDSQHSFFQYKSITPQPDFAAAYDFIDANSFEGEPVITPYPTIQELYAPQRTQYCLYIDLTGTAPQSPTVTERYTDCPYLTESTLCQVLQEGIGYILLDQFARQRIEPNLLQLITSYAKPVYTNSSGWSSLIIYEPKAVVNCHITEPSAL